MKKRFFSLLSVFTIVFVILATNIAPSINVKAMNPEYYTPGGDDLDDMFETLDKDALLDFDGFIDWLTTREDFPVIERGTYSKGGSIAGALADQDAKTNNAPTGAWGYKAWLNVPNLQGIIYGKLDGAFACGYAESGKDMDECTKNAMYPTTSDGNTAMKQLGFDIPSITYKGEYPVVEYELSNVLPHGVWGTIKSAIKFLFGGSITEAPDTDDFTTLCYVNLTDYIDDYAISRWIADFWLDTCEWFYDEDMEDQGLLPKSICGNKESKADGKHYTVDNCIFEEDLDDPESLGYDISTVTGASEFNKLLKTTWGQYYSPVMTSIIYFSDEDDEACSVSNRPLRDMPYYPDSMDSSYSEIDLDLVQDPRCDADAIFGIVHQRDKHAVKHNLYPKLISFFAKIAEFTWFIDQLTDFDILEANGMHVDVLWHSPVLKIILGLFFIFFVFHASKNAIKIAKGNSSPMEGISKTLVGVAMCLGIASLIVAPDNTYALFKKFMKLPETMASAMFTDNVTKTFMDDTATAEDKYDMSYWVPYFEMWSVYNTNHSLSSKTQIIDKDDGTTEVACMIPTEIGSKENTRWDLTLAYSFSSGYEVKRDAYRVVDHFLAPRFEVHKDEVITTDNENFNGDIQTRVGANWIVICCVLCAEIVKVFLFINVASQFAFLIIFVVFRYRDEKCLDTFKSFGFAYFMYFMSVLFVPLVSNFTYYADSEFIACLVLAVLYFAQLAGVAKWNARRPDWMQPMILVALRQKKWRRG